MKSRTGEVNVGMLIMVGLAIVAIIVGYMMYSKHNQRLAYEEHMRREVAREEREKAEAERKKAEEEAERRQMQIRQERERAESEREAKRQAEKRERELAAKEKQRAIAEQEAQKMFYVRSKRVFDGMEAKIAIDVPEGLRPDFVGKGLDGWCLFPSFDEDGKIFYQTNDVLKGCRLLVLDGRANPTEADKAVFASRIGCEKSVIRTKDGVWIFNAPRNGSTYPLPEEGSKFVPAAMELLELYDMMKGLGVTLKDVRSRLTLKSKDGEHAVPLGVIGYEDSIDREKIEELVGEKIREWKKKSAKNLNSVKSPKLKKFRPTVVFYDGEVIKKTMEGITYVPRNFVYHGTSRNNDRHAHVDDIKRRAEENWKRLSEEAKRQETRAAEIALENERVKSRHEQTLRSARDKLSKVKSEEIEKELSNWVIQVERGRSRQKK